MSPSKNPLLCDPSTGVCELPTEQDQAADSSIRQEQEKPIKIIYFTDPICSSCWGIEPQLRKLKLEYGNVLDIEYRMGGLLPDWSYNSGGISKPSDVAHHWDEVSLYYDMPIDGDVWLEDPLSSSYPPSIAFKAAQLQSEEKAIQFLRVIREMVFLEKKNITKWEHLEQAAQQVGLSINQFKTDYEGTAQLLFQEDLKLSKSLGVRGFPTMFFVDSLGKQRMVYGTQPYSSFETTLLQLYPRAQKNTYNSSPEYLFQKFHSLTALEFSILTTTPRHLCEKELDALQEKIGLEKLSTKNGSLWRVKE